MQIRRAVVWFWSFSSNSLVWRGEKKKEGAVKIEVQKDKNDQNIKKYEERKRRHANPCQRINKNTGNTLRPCLHTSFFCFWLWFKKKNPYTPMVY